MKKIAVFFLILTVVLSACAQIQQGRFTGRITQLLLHNKFVFAVEIQIGDKDEGRVEDQTTRIYISRNDPSLNQFGIGDKVIVDCYFFGEHLLYDYNKKIARDSCHLIELLK